MPAPNYSFNYNTFGPQAGALSRQQATQSLDYGNTAANMADPVMGQRAQYQQRLSGLLSDPNAALQNDPTLKFLQSSALNASNANNARTGNLLSGRGQVELADRQQGVAASYIPTLAGMYGKFGGFDSANPAAAASNYGLFAARSQNLGQQALAQDNVRNALPTGNALPSGGGAGGMNSQFNQPLGQPSFGQTTGTMGLYSPNVGQPQTPAQISGPAQTGGTTWQQLVSGTGGVAGTNQSLDSYDPSGSYFANEQYRPGGQDQQPGGQIQQSGGQYDFSNSGQDFGNGGYDPNVNFSPGMSLQNQPIQAIDPNATSMFGNGQYVAGGQQNPYANFDWNQFDTSAFGGGYE